MSPLFVYNTLSQKKEEFKSLKKKKVTMYVCGPTVYNYIHVGNARPMVFFDVVSRYLKYKGYDVVYVRNITDIDDKIIKRSQDEKRDSGDISRQYTEAFNEDMKSLGLVTPTYEPKATDHISGMIAWIEKLIHQKMAYVEKGEVLYSIEKFKSYGKLSKRNTEDLIAGARVEVSKHKKNPIDFVLWKPSKLGEPSWDSPWGKGRPGWHMECSVMSTKYLGASFDIHGGGVDLIFPHHENEIAQSEAVTLKPFVQYWMHNEHVSFGKEKMSKSLGNIVTVHDFLKNYPAELLKFILLSNHYRSSLEFSDRVIRESILSLEKIYTTLFLVAEKMKEKGKTSIHSDLKKEIDEFWPKFEQAMDDDFNTTQALGFIFDLIRVVNRELSQKDKRVSEKMLKDIQKIFQNISSIWGILGEEPNDFLAKLSQKLLQQKSLSSVDIEKFIHQREEARKNKDFKRADEIRKSLLSQGVLLEDTPNGTTWKVQK